MYLCMLCFLGSHAHLQFCDESLRTACAGSKGRREASVLLLPGSLLVFNSDAYTGCLHGIAEVSCCINLMTAAMLHYPILP